MMDPACALTAFYHVDAARSIADDARKTNAILTLSRHRNARMGLLTLPSCYMVVFHYLTSLSLVNQRTCPKLYLTAVTLSCL